MLYVAFLLVSVQPRFCGTFCVMCMLSIVSPPVAIEIFFVHTPYWCGTCNVLLSELLAPWRYLVYLCTFLVVWLLNCIVFRFFSLLVAIQLIVHTSRWCGTCSFEFIVHNPGGCGSCSELLLALLALRWLLSLLCTPPPPSVVWHL